MEDLKKKYETDVEQIQQLQKDYSKAVANLQKLESQLKENEMVLDELKRLGQDAPVYKLLGPVLLKQDKEESKQNVEKRLEFIRKEIQRIERHMKEIQEKEEKKRIELIALQQQLQQLTVSA